MKEYLSEIIVTEFDDSSAVEFRRQVLEYSQLDTKEPIRVYINSYGGEVESMAFMIETLKSIPNPVHTICLGKAYSCGAILLSFGDIRSIGRYSTIMLHEISSGAFGSSSEMEISVREVKRQNQFWLKQVAKNCKIPYKELSDKIDKGDLFLTPKQAKTLGIVDRICVLKPKLTEKKIKIEKQPMIVGKSDE